MSLQINIIVNDDAIADQTMLDQHLAHIGFSRTGRVVAAHPALAAPYGVQIEPAVTNTDRAGESEAQHAVRRERGQPSGGRARRTKAEIAEDEAADKADAAAGTTQAISSGGERVGPEDDEATQARDRADEEAEERKPDAPTKTLQDLILEGKAAIGEYAQKFGFSEAQEDGVLIFNAVLGTPKSDSGWKWSVLADMNDFTGVQKAVAAWKSAAAGSSRFAS